MFVIWLLFKMQDMTTIVYNSALIIFARNILCFLTKTYRLFVWFCSSSHILFMLHCDWAAVVATTTTKQILPDHLMYVAEVNVKVIAT